MTPPLRLDFAIRTCFAKEPDEVGRALSGQSGLPRRSRAINKFLASSRTQQLACRIRATCQEGYLRLPCDRVPSCARAREVPVPSARLISAVHSSGYLLATIGRSAQTHTHEKDRQGLSGFIDIPWSPGYGQAMTTCGQRSPCACGCFPAVLTYQLDSAARFWQRTCG